MSDVLLTDVLAFKLNEEGNLFAEYTHRGIKPDLDETAIKQALAKQGLSRLYLHETSLSQLISQYTTLEADFVLEIGERRDGAYLVKVDDDRMAARLTLIPPYGGVPVTLPQVLQALQEKGVVSGIMITTIEAVLKKGYATDVVVAEGQKPEPGTDAQFQSLLPKIAERKPQEDEHGNVDYRELGGIIFVKQGTALMRRIPPTAGKNGQDVTGSKSREGCAVCVKIARRTDRRGR